MKQLRLWERSTVTVETVGSTAITIDRRTAGFVQKTEDQEPLATVGLLTFTGGGY